jgi:hypothetical protein
MADLEDLALKRDRSYLVRLIAMMLLGIAASIFVWRGLTGETTSGCIATAFLGQDAAPPAKPANPSP